MRSAREKGHYCILLWWRGTFVLLMECVLYAFTHVFRLHAAFHWSVAPCYSFDKYENMRWRCDAFHPLTHPPLSIRPAGTKIRALRVQAGQRKRPAAGGSFGRGRGRPRSFCRWRRQPRQQPRLGVQVGQQNTHTHNNYLTKRDNWPFLFLGSIPRVLGKSPGFANKISLHGRKPPRRSTVRHLHFLPSYEVPGSLDSLLLFFFFFARTTRTELRHFFFMSAPSHFVCHRTFCSCEQQGTTEMMQILRTVAAARPLDKRTSRAIRA